jgi:GT2 family glycosyltransferase
MLAVLASSFNRRETTLRGLRALAAAGRGINYRIFLVDDGSTDGTRDAVISEFPEVAVLDGDGSLFWNGGMRVAWQAAMPCNPDYYLWWNDDLELLPAALCQLLSFQSEMEKTRGPKVISVGKVADPDTGAVTYGGYVIPRGLSKLRFKRTASEGPCDTMNGNCVLIPNRAVEEVGIHSPHYTHGSGDVDYGLRATKRGYLIFQTPFVVGYTAFNQQYHDKISKLRWKNRNFILFDPKGVPISEWWHFCRSHGGILWPINFVVRYLKLLGPQF